MRPLAIIDLGDLESLEGLAQQGHSILEILSGWKHSDIAELSLRNYLLENFPWNPKHYRPSRMQPRVKAAQAEIAALLRIRPTVVSPEQQEC